MRGSTDILKVTARVWIGRDTLFPETGGAVFKGDIIRGDAPLSEGVMTCRGHIIRSDEDDGALIETRSFTAGDLADRIRRRKSCSDLAKKPYRLSGLLHIPRNYAKAGSEASADDVREHVALSAACGYLLKGDFRDITAEHVDIASKLIADKLSYYLTGYEDMRKADPDGFPKRSYLFENAVRNEIRGSGDKYPAIARALAYRFSLSDDSDEVAFTDYKGLDANDERYILGYIEDYSHSVYKYRKLRAREILSYGGALGGETLENNREPKSVSKLRKARGKLRDSGPDADDRQPDDR